MKFASPPGRRTASAESVVNRRNILGGGGLIAAAATVAAVLQPQAAEAFQATSAEKAGRYQETAHVKRFYALNRR